MAKLTVTTIMEQFKVQPTECLILVFHKKHTTVDGYNNLHIQLPKCQIIKAPRKALPSSYSNFKPSIKEHKFIPTTEDEQQIDFIEYLHEAPYLASFLTIYNTPKGKPHHIDFEALFNKSKVCVLVLSYGRFFKNRQWINAAYYNYHRNKQENIITLERFVSDFD